MGKVFQDVGIVVKGDASGPVVAVVGAHGRESEARGIREILVLDACALSVHVN